METRFAMTYTLYAQNLTNPARSFAPDITLKDFRRNVWTDVFKANKVVYINPRGTSIILKDRHGEKT
jgi:hypothetical protein